MDLIRIDEDNLSFFEDILFLENHTAGVPVFMIGALEEGYPAAAAVLEIDGRVSRLISIYVEKPYRRKGIGAEMVKRFFDLSHENGLEAMEVDFVQGEGMQEFFEYVGFSLFFGNEVLYLPVDEVVATKQFQNFISNADNELHCVSFSNLSGRLLRSAYQNVGIEYDDTMEEQINADYSAVLMEHGDQPVGILTLVNSGADLIITDFVAGEHGIAGYSTLLAYLYRNLKSRKGDGLFIGFIGADDRKLAMVSEIAGDMIDFERGETVVHGIKA